MQREKVFMTPKEATDIMRQESIELIDFGTAMSKVNPKNFTKEELHNWFTGVVAQFAVFKWSMANILEDLSKDHPFTIEQQHENNSSQLSIAKIDISKPPLEVDYFESEP